jgi:DNA-binding MarR family transcriptional regulator
MPAPSRSDLDTLADVVVRLRRALRRGVRAAIQSELDPQGTGEHLPVAQIEVLQLLADRPGLRAGEVGDALLLAPTTVSTLVSALLAGALIERVPDPADRRAWQLRLTDAGGGELIRWQEANKRVLQEAFSHLTATDQRALHGALPALAKLVGHLDAAG